MSLQVLVGEVQAAAEEFTSGNSKGHGHLLRAIQNLNLAVETPAETLTRILYQPVQSAVVRIAVEIGLPVALSSKSNKSMTATELSIETKASKALIVRLMRVLTAMKLCDEVNEEEYKANTVTETLAAHGFNGGTKYIDQEDDRETNLARLRTDVFFPAAARLTEFLHETNFQSPEDKSVFEFTFGTDLWSYLAQNPSMQKNMMDYMGGRRKGGQRWLDIYPAESELQGTLKSADDVLLVDIGGNQGHDLKDFRERHPNLPGKLVLMDLPEAIENNKSDMSGIKMIPYNFFAAQPIIGARIYFFRAVLHDWSDKKCLELLSNTVKAMEKEYSRLLINDYVLPETGCDLHHGLLDIAMMTLACGVERTEKQWRELLDAAGLEIVKIWSSPGVESVIETKLKD